MIMTTQVNPSTSLKQRVLEMKARSQVRSLEAERRNRLSEALRLEYQCTQLRTHFENVGKNLHSIISRLRDLDGASKDDLDEAMDEVNIALRKVRTDFRRVGA
jgi:hypothetical protein